MSTENKQISEDKILFFKKLKQRQFLFSLGLYLIVAIVIFFMLKDNIDYSNILEHNEQIPDNKSSLSFSVIIILVGSLLFSVIPCLIIAHQVFVVKTNVSQLSPAALNDFFKLNSHSTALNKYFPQIIIHDDYFIFLQFLQFGKRKFYFNEIHSIKMMSSYNEGVTYTFIIKIKREIYKRTIRGNAHVAQYLFEIISRQHPHIATHIDNPL